MGSKYWIVATIHNAFVLILTISTISACTPAITQTPIVITPTSIDQIPITSNSTNILTDNSTEGVISLQTFENTQESFFCTQQIDISETNGMNIGCDQGTLNLFIRGGKEGRYRYLTLATPIESTQSFTINADVVSIPGESTRIDQNQYGFLLIIDPQNGYRLHMKGQYFKLDRYLITFDNQHPEGDFHIKQQWNWNFSPAIKPAGETNHLQFSCTANICDFQANDVLIGRFSLDETPVISEAGLLGYIEGDKEFGVVKIDNLHMVEADIDQPIQLFSLEDDLKSDKGTFSSSGLSGAFHSYLEDGYHFSAVVPYRHYGVRTGPALQDVVVSASVSFNREYATDSAFAGVVCRSNKEGMYNAAIRPNGTYVIYRDTPNTPFTLLAGGPSKSILTDGAINTLRLECVGSDFTFYINDQLVKKITDNRINLQCGRAGLYTKSGKFPHEDAITFTDFKIEEIRN